MNGFRKLQPIILFFLMITLTACTQVPDFGQQPSMEPPVQSFEISSSLLLEEPPTSETAVNEAEEKGCLEVYDGFILDTNHHLYQIEILPESEQINEVFIADNIKTMAHRNSVYSSSNLVDVIDLDGNGYRIAKSSGNIILEKTVSGLNDIKYISGTNLVIKNDDSLWLYTALQDPSGTESIYSADELHWYFLKDQVAYAAIVPGGAIALDKDLKLWKISVNYNGVSYSEAVYELIAENVANVQAVTIGLNVNGMVAYMTQAEELWAAEFGPNSTALTAKLISAEVKLFSCMQGYPAELVYLSHDNQWVHYSDGEQKPLSIQLGSPRYIVCYSETQLTEQNHFAYKVIAGLDENNQYIIQVTEMVVSPPYLGGE